MNRKKSDLPGFMIPAAVAVFLVSAFALLLLFNFILSDYANGGEIKPPVIESSPPVTETTDTPEPTETPVPIETPQPTPTETPVGPDATQALFTGKASDYAAMPKTYGEARNLLCYTILDARDVTYENFLKLEIDMSLSDVMDILSDAEADSYYRSSTDSTRWDFSSNPTKISVETIDDKVIETIFYDPFRVCVDPADISRSAVLQIEAGMRLDEVEGLLGGDFFVSAISAKSEDTTTLTWYCNEGEIIIIFDSSNIVTAFMQAGFQRYPDARMKYDVLTNRQLLDNFQKVSLGITYPELEELMDNYIPLFKTKVNIDRSGTEETYEFARGHSEDAMSIHFVFRDGMLYEASALAIPKALLTTTDSSSALQIEEGMSYSEVVEILGEGYKARVDISYNGREHETYRWLILGEYSYFQVTFEDGFVYRKPYIP